MFVIPVPITYLYSLFHHDLIKVQGIITYIHIIIHIMRIMRTGSLSHSSRMAGQDYCEHNNGFEVIHVVHNNHGHTCIVDTKFPIYFFLFLVFLLF